MVGNRKSGLATSLWGGCPERSLGRGAEDQGQSVSSSGPLPARPCLCLFSFVIRRKGAPLLILIMRALYIRKVSYKILSEKVSPEQFEG